jgi:phosphomevalonate kinase
VSVYFAPGKLVVLGEYAVLDGAPALVAAVDHGVRCEVAPGAALAIETPDSDDRFVGPALAAAEAPAATYRFEGWPPRHGPKLGLGTSAAATVAAVIAGRAERGAPIDPTTLRAVATHVHRAVQGSGSGLDVAASCHGGLIRFQAGAVTPVATPAPPFAVIWSGAAAATGPRVARYLALADRDPFVASSAALVQAFEADPIAAVREAFAQLTAMAARADLGYLTPALQRIADLAVARGGAAKPSGAGGGDVAIAILPDVDALASFNAACARAALPPVPIHLAPGAARLESRR